MAEASEQPEGRDGGIEIQAGGKADGGEQGEEFSGRDLQHVQHGLGTTLSLATRSLRTAKSRRGMPVGRPRAAVPTYFFHILQSPAPHMIKYKGSLPYLRSDPQNTAIRCAYSVDSISKPQASRRGSGMYLEFLLRRAHSRRRVDRRYWSGESLYSRTTCSNSVMVGVIGPIGSGLPQFGFPRRLAMKNAFPLKGMKLQNSLTKSPNYMILRVVLRIQFQEASQAR